MGKGMCKGTESGCQARAGIQFAAASGMWNGNASGNVAVGLENQWSATAR